MNTLMTKFIAEKRVAVQSWRLLCGAYDLFRVSATNGVCGEQPPVVFVLLSFRKTLK